MQVIDRIGGQRQFGKDDQVDSIVVRLAGKVQHGPRIGPGISDRGGGRRGGDADQTMSVKRVKGVILHPVGIAAWEGGRYPTWLAPG